MDALLSNRNLLAAALYIIIVSSINLVQCQDYNRISKRIQRQSQYGGSGSGDYVFPDYAPTTKYYRSSRHDTSDSNELPLEMLKQMSLISNFTELFESFVDPESMDEAEVISSRFSGNDEIVEKSVGIKATQATCIPQMSVVSLVPEDANDPSMFYWPSCTRLNRCGGCCLTNILACTPIESVTKIFEVSKFQFAKNGKNTFKGKLPVPIQEHTKCKCDCRVKSEDCTKLQQYDQSQCRCNCVNMDDRAKCYAENNTKIWDADVCSCRCRDIGECTTGTYFDNSKCKCIEMPNDNSSARAADRKSYILKPILVGQTEDQKYLSNKK